MIAADDNQADDTFGLCPRCRRHDGYVNVGSEHIFRCEAHRLKWSYGSNIFSEWRHETEKDWRANLAYLSQFEEVAAFYWPETLAAAAAEPDASDTPGNPFDGFGV